MDNHFLYAQIFGCIACAITIWRLQFKNPRYIALGEVPTAFFWSLQYFLLNAHAGLIINALCIIRGALVYFVPDVFLKYVIGIFLCLVTTILLSISFDIFNLLALIAVYIYATSCMFRDNRPIMARLILIHNFPWIAYNVIFLSYFGILASTLGIVSVIIGMYRHENWEINNSPLNFIKSLLMISSPPLIEETNYV